jgi:HemY protein
VRWWVIIIGILALSSLATIFALEDPGYVLIARAPWSMEMSLIVFTTLLGLGFFAFLILIYVLVRIWRIPRDVSHWRQKRQFRNARKTLNEGLIRLAEGHWVEAEANILASMRHSDAPLIANLAAACAAQAQGNTEKRDEYLADAQKAAPENRLAVGLIQAYLQRLSQQTEQALATLSELQQLAPEHKQVLRLLAQSFIDVRDWTALRDIISDLRQHESMSPEELDVLELRAHRELLTLTLPSGSSDVLERAWHAVPKRLREHPDLIAIYARHLIRQKQMPQAETVLRKTIDRQWREDLVELYGLVETDDVDSQLDHADTWLGQQGEVAILYLTLGRLARRSSSRQSASRGFFEKCLALNGPVACYLELGTLLEQTGDMEQALATYHQALTYVNQLTDNKIATTPASPTGSRKQQAIG